MMLPKLRYVLARERAQGDAEIELLDYQIGV